MPRLIFPNQTRFIPTGSTYDRMQWPFIKNVMEEVVLPADLIKFIMACISFFHTNVMWNGGRSKFFKT